jgi:hypothetical protein
VGIGTDVGAEQGQFVIQLPVGTVPVHVAEHDVGVGVAIGVGVGGGGVGVVCGTVKEIVEPGEPELSPIFVTESLHNVTYIEYVPGVKGTATLDVPGALL